MNSERKASNQIRNLEGDGRNTNNNNEKTEELCDMRVIGSMSVKKSHGVLRDRVHERCELQVEIRWG